MECDKHIGAILRTKLENNLSARLYLSVIVSLFFSACIPVIPVHRPALPQTEPKMSRSSKGVVVTAHPLATDAGVKMLQAGGNAVDAAVAAAFSLAVVGPSMSGIGGRAQILIYTAQGEIHGIDATTQVPSNYDHETAPQAKYGYPTVAVPGVVAGLTKASQLFGTLPRETVMASAIEYAGDGYSILPGELFRQSLVIEKMKEFEGTRQHFLKADGSLYSAGETFVQKDLAAVLEAVAAEGPDVFYRGWIAEKMVLDVQRNGGVLTRESLADYRAEESHIVTGSYRGYDLAALWTPSYGAIAIEALQILEQFPDSLFEGPDWARAIYHGISAAYLDRKEQKSLADAHRLTSKEWAKFRAAETGLLQEEADASKSLPPGSRYAGPISPAAWTEPYAHTSHLTVVDRDGMIVCLTQTVGPIMGSKVVTPGLGFIYAATLGGYLGEMQAGQRAVSHIAPLLVLKNDRPLIAMGAAGGSRIISALVAITSRIIDQGRPLSEAVALPRVHPTEAGIDLERTGEGGWSTQDSSYLAGLGYSITMKDRPGMFGRANIVMLDTLSGEWIGVSDPDWEGTAGVPLK
tara:strand:+ start:3432 stop:5162 length:1731 start_codon:yes stop_codon:yes gene_type:complete